jgi:hypothetical protein
MVLDNYNTVELLVSMTNNRGQIPNCIEAASACILEGDWDGTLHMYGPEGVGKEARIGLVEVENLM